MSPRPMRRYRPEAMHCADCGRRLTPPDEVRVVAARYRCVLCAAKPRLVFGDDSPRDTAMGKLKGPEIPTDWRPVADPEATA